MCLILAPEAQFPGHFGPQIDNNSSHFIKHFPLVSHHSCFTCLLGVLLWSFQLCAPKALFLGLELRLQRSLLCHHGSCIERVTYYTIRSSNENVFCVSVPLWEESTRQRWIPFEKGRLYGPLMFLCCLYELSVEQTVCWPVIRDDITVIWHRCNVYEFVCICTTITK